jgi:hypothetical protein
MSLSDSCIRTMRELDLGKELLTVFSWVSYLLSMEELVQDDDGQQMDVLHGHGPVQRTTHWCGSKSMRVVVQAW